jgi:hypothetical protein
VGRLPNSALWYEIQKMVGVLYNTVLQVLSLYCFYCCQ